MAVRIDSYVIDEIGLVNIKWPGLLNADTGLPVTVTSKFWKLTLQVSGTFGAGGTVLLEGSNDGTNYSTLKDVGGTAISITDTSIARLEGIPQYIRPRVSAGDGTTNLSAFIHGVI